jgi:sugar phosphate permease
LAAAISSIEATKAYNEGGFTNWRFYFFLAIFITSVVMYFIRKKQRLEQK